MLQAPEASPPILVFNEGIWWTNHARQQRRSAIIEKHEELLSRVRSLAELWSSHARQARGGRHRLSPARRVCLLWRETSPQDFSTASGAWPGLVYRGTRWGFGERCIDHNDGTSSPWDGLNAILERAGIPVVRVWARSRMYAGLHLEARTPHTMAQGVDCTHYCTPGVVDTWVQPLLDSIRESCARQTLAATGAQAPPGRSRVGEQ